MNWLCYLCYGIRFLSIVLLFASANAAEPLTDLQMDGVTAGAATAPQYGQPLPQHQTGSVDVIDTVTLDGEIIDQSIQGNELIIAADSQAEFQIDKQLNFSDGVQKHSSAMNITNSVASDVTQSLNVASGSYPANHSLTQANLTQQSENKLARVALSNWDSGYRFEKHLQDYTSNNIKNTFSQELQRDFSDISTHRINSVDVAIEKYDPRLLLAEVKLMTPDYGPLVLIPAEEFNGRISGGILNDLDIFDVIPDYVDYQLGWGETSLDLGHLSAGIDRNTVSNEFLTINLSADPPSLSLGEIYFNTQAEGGPLVKWIDTQPVLIDPLPEIDVDIDVPNPLYGLDMSINHGFALAGSGEIKGDFGGINLLAQVNVTNILSEIFPLGPIIDVIQTATDIANAADFLDIFPDIPGPADLDLALEFEIPINIGLNPDDSVLDGLDQLDGVHIVRDSAEGYPIHIKYDGVFCFELFGDGECGSATDITTTVSVQDYSYSHSLDEQISFSESFNESHQKIIRTGGILAGGEAEKIILSGSDLVSNETSTIQLSSESQSHARSLNLTNASASIAANSLNIQNFKLMQFNASQLTAAKLNQSNRFIQVR